MSPTHSACLIPLVKKITTDCDLFHTPRPTFSSFVLASHRPPRSKTSARSGSPRFTTTAPAFPASSSAPKWICGTTPVSERNSRNKRWPL